MVVPFPVQTLNSGADGLAAVIARRKAATASVI